MTTEQPTIPLRRRPVAARYIAVSLAGTFALEIIQGLLLTHNVSPAQFTGAYIFSGLLAALGNLGRYAVIVALIPVVFALAIMSLRRAVNRSFLFLLSILILLFEAGLLAQLLFIYVRWVRKPI